MVAYWPWVVYPMGKCALILKGGTYCSAMLAAAMQGSCHTCSCYEGCISIYLYPVPFYAVFYYGLPFWLEGYVGKLITL